MKGFKLQKQLFIKLIASTLFMALFSACTSTASQMRLSSINDEIASLAPGDRDQDRNAGIQVVDQAPFLSDGVISFSQVNQTEATVSWPAASDQETGPADLQYKLVYATDPLLIDTVEEIQALSTNSILMDFALDKTSAEVSGLAADTTYYFAVVVKDAADNQALYETQSVQTLDRGLTAPPEFSDYPVVSNLQMLDISITSATTSAFICYTIDGSTPVIVASSCGVGMLMNNGDSVIFQAEGNHKLKAIAGAAGHRNSAVSSASYTLDHSVIKDDELIITEFMAHPGYYTGEIIRPVREEGDELDNKPKRPEAAFVENENGEYIEIYNNGDRALSFAESPVSFELTVVDGETTIVTLDSGVIEPKSYFLLCKEESYVINGGLNCDLSDSSLTLADNKGVIKLYDSQALLLDRVHYHSMPTRFGWSRMKGRSFELNSNYFGSNSENANHFFHWHLGYFPYGGSGQTKALGTPGAANSKPLLVSEVMMSDRSWSSNQQTISEIEFIELYNPNSYPVNLRDADFTLGVYGQDLSITANKMQNYRFSDARIFKNQEFPTNLVIPAKGYYLIAGKKTDENHPWLDKVDATLVMTDREGSEGPAHPFLDANGFGINLSISKGKIHPLRNFHGRNRFILDYFLSGFRDATIDRRFLTSSAPLLPENHSYQRKEGTEETHDSAENYVLQELPDPQGSKSGGTGGSF